MLRWVDVLYTDEGAVEAMAGESGKDYTTDADGSWSYAGDVEALSSYILYNLSIYDTGNMPWLFPLDFYSRYGNASIGRVNAQLLSLREWIVKPFPAYTLTPVQEDEIAPAQKALGRYVDESLARFVTGEWDVNDPAAISAYQSGLAAHGKDAFVAFWQEIADTLTK